MRTENVTEYDHAYAPFVSIADDPAPTKTGSATVSGGCGGVAQTT
jgi:hypothetical protein